MDLRPTQEYEKALSVQQHSLEAPPSPLSSRAQPRDLRFRGTLLEMFFDRSRDLLSLFSAALLTLGQNRSLQPLP
jgi:hypothetical protein